MSLGCLGHCKFSFLLNLMFTQFPSSVFSCLAIIINNNPFLFELFVSKQCRFHAFHSFHLTSRSKIRLLWHLELIWIWMWTNVMLSEGELFSLY